MKQADNIMRQAVSKNIFPGGILLASKKGRPVFFKAYGLANIYTKRPVKKETVFDLASLTKPCATALAIMRLVEMNALALTNSLGALLPDFKNSEKEGITVKQLLSHTSGLPDYRPYYETLCNLSFEQRKMAQREMLVKEALENSPGKKTIYSDLGFMILSWIVEHVTDLRLDRFVEKEIYHPYGLKNLFFPGLNSAEDNGREFAATEDCPWRKTVLNSVVHDDNAFVVGGVDGHAGLFGTADDLNTLLSHLLSEYHGTSDQYLFRKETLHTFFKPQEGGDRTLGFDTPSVENSSSGHYFSKKTVGHLGYTGTSFWMDLEKSVIIILLTNRVHPSRENEKIRAFRPTIHDAIMKNI